MRRFSRPVSIGCGLLLLAGILALTAGCSSTGATSPTARTGISRERAIEIAREQVSFSPTSIDAVKDTFNGRPAWAVTFRASDGSHGGIGQFLIVWVDRRTGEIVSLAIASTRARSGATDTRGCWSDLLRTVGSVSV